MCKTTSKPNIVENNIEGSAQMKYNISVIVNGSITMNSDKVPLYTTGATEIALNYNVQVTDLLDDCECDSVPPRRELQRINGNKCKMVLIGDSHAKGCASKLHEKLKEHG
jgi:hypothetical protein